MTARRSFCAPAATVAWTVLALAIADATAATPTISKISPRGLQAPGTTTLAVDGTDLLPEPRLLLGVPVKGQALKPGSTPQRVELEITLDEPPAPGTQLLRVVTSAGVSNALPISVDGLPQAPFGPKIASLPVALGGALEGSTVLVTAFEGRKGQRIVAEVESKRLGANLNPTVRLLDARGVQLAWGAPTAALSGDARCQATLPADGTYQVEVADQLFRGAGPGYFRLKVGELQFADQVYPLGVQRGAKTELAFASSSLPESARALIEPAQSGEWPAPWPRGLGAAAGPAPPVLVSDHAELIESAADKQPQQLPAAPVAVSGRLGVAGETDRFSLPVSPGQVLRFDLLAARAFSPIDGVLTLHNEQGAQLAANDDRPGTTDPGLAFTVPAGVKVLTVAVRDLSGRGGRESIYRLAIMPASLPSFSLEVFDDRLLLPAGAAALARVRANRAGYGGPIKLAIDPLPPGVQAAGLEIPAGATDALVTLASASPGMAPSLVSIRGASDGNPPTTATAMTGGSPVTRRQPWLRTQLALAVVPAGPLAVTWEAASADQKLVAGNPLPMKLTVARAAGAAGPVRLTLVTSQIQPKKTVKLNNQDRVVDDLARTLRFKGSPRIAGDQSSGSFDVLVPADLPLVPHDLSVRAELLSTDQKTVLAAADTPARRLPVVASPSQPPLAVFEDQAEFVAALNQGGGQASLLADDKFSGAASIKVTPDQRFNPALPGLGVKIRQYPGPGEYRFLQFAWKKQGGQSICLQLNHDGAWGPSGGNPAKFRYHAGPGPECYGASVAVDGNLPAGFVVVTRDLFADFGEFTLNGLALSPVDGEFALFDHIYLGKSPADFDSIKP